MANLEDRRLPPVWWNMLFVGMTAVLVGYFGVWLPGPAAGLRLLGFELGEWIKFLGVGPSRNLFYLPPIVLGFIMALLSAGWGNDRLQTWLYRGLAIAVSLLAFPAIAAITGEAPSEWLARLIGIALVVGAVLLAALTPPQRWPARWVWWAVMVLGLVGITLPLAQYAAVGPIVSAILRQPIGFGLGLWLNSLGYLLIVIVAVRALFGGKQNRSPVPNSGHQ